jgi:hypothetical protein
MTISKEKVIVFGIGFLILFVALGLAGAQLVSAGGPAKVQRGNVNWHPQSGTGVVAGARAQLVRTDGNVSASFQARDLIPGHVYSMWFLFINNPGECSAYPADCTAGDILFNTEEVQADVTYGGGIVAGGSGMGTLSGHVAEGALANAWFGNGFQDARQADIHLVVNDHGPAIPGMVDEMLHSYRGGCTDDSLPPPFPATAKSDGVPGPNTCRLYQSATFQP